jgi:hypothetical protein
MEIISTELTSIIRPKAENPRNIKNSGLYSPSISSADLTIQVIRQSPKAMKVLNSCEKRSTRRAP